MDIEKDIYNYMTTKPFNVEWLIDEIAAIRQNNEGKLTANTLVYHYIKDYEDEIIKKGDILTYLGYPHKAETKNDKVYKVLNLVLELCEIIGLEYEFKAKWDNTEDRCISYEEYITKEEKRRKAIEKCKTPRANKYMPRAIREGYIIECGNCYKWTFGGKVRLAYFLHEVYNPKGTEQIPYKILETLFNVKRLDTAIDQALNAKNEQKWRSEIDEKIFFD